VKGLAGTGGSVVVGGNFSGAGILVIRDAECLGSGSFSWEGLIIVTGEHVGFRVDGAENKELYGGLIINETGPASGPGPALLDVRGSIRILFSRSAFANIAGVIPPTSLARLYEDLPFAVKQDYWRAVNP
jgi:hypothetical protein